MLTREPSSSDSSSELGTAELVQRVTSDAKELIRLEVALAKDELNQELAGLKTCAILAGVATVLALTGVAALVVALGLVLGPLGALAVALLLLSSGGALGFLAYRRFPKKPMAATGHRLEHDKELLKEQLT